MAESFDTVTTDLPSGADAWKQHHCTRQEAVGVFLPGLSDGDGVPYSIEAFVWQPEELVLNMPHEGPP